MTLVRVPTDVVKMRLGSLFVISKPQKTVYAPATNQLLGVVAPASLLQLTSPLSTAPCTSRSVAVSCIEAFTVRFAVAGLIVIELSTGLDTGSEGRSTTQPARKAAPRISQ